MPPKLIILRDPAGLLGREVRLLDECAPLQHQIEATMPCGGDCELLINGERADPFTDPRLDAPPRPDDVVVVANRPAGDPITWVAVISALLAVASYAAIPKINPTPTATDSPNNRLTGQTNVARAYQAIPDVYGRRRVWPDLIQPSSVEYRNHVKFVTEWMVVSRGAGTISDVRFAETPLADVDGASWTVFVPGQAPPLHGGLPGPSGIPAPPVPAPPPGVPAGYAEALTTRVTQLAETFQVEDVNGQELTAAQPYKLVEAGFAITYTGTTTVTATFTDGEQWDQIKAAPKPLTISQFRFRRLFGGSTFNTTRTGSITGISSASGIVTVNITLSSALGQSLPFEVIIQPAGVSAYNKVGPFTLPIDDANRIRWNTTFLRGLKGAADILTEWWKVDSGGVEIAGSRQAQTFTYSADTYDQQFFTTEVEPSAGAGRYRIEFTRQDAPNADGSDVATLEEVYATRYTDIKDFVAQGVTIIKVETRATTQASGIRERKFNLIWERNVRTLTGDAASASRNVFRAMAHLWTISGQPMTDLDVTPMQAINTALGEASALLRFDGSLDDADMSLEERMQLMANHARCVFWRDGTKWTVTRDQARSTPELQLDYRNLADGRQSTVNESFHLPGSRDGVEVEYVDEVTGAKKAYVRLNITTGTPVAGVVTNPEKVQLSGCTTAAQAENRAQLEARKLLYQRTSVTENALGDAQQLGPLSLVRWVDPADFAGDDGLQAGEVLAAAGALLTLSEPLDFKGQPSGRIQFTGDDGMLLGLPVVCTPVVGQPTQVTLASVPVGIFVAAPPASQVGSRYAFGVGLTESEMNSAGLYTVTEPRPNGDGTWSLAMVNYDARIYAAD